MKTKRNSWSGIISDNVLPTVWLVQSLASSEQDVIVQVLRRPAECSLRREGLHAVAKLLKDTRGKVSASASSVLRSLAAQPRQREQVRGWSMCALCECVWAPKVSPYPCHTIFKVYFSFWSQSILTGKDPPSFTVKFQNSLCRYNILIEIFFSFSSLYFTVK